MEDIILLLNRFLEGQGDPYIDALSLEV